MNNTSGRRVFLAVATGQNVSNLPPILEMARPGDAFAWILSGEARAQNWAEPSSAVLKRHRVQELPEPAPLDQVSDPAAIAGRISAWAQRHAAGAEIYVVLNGGTKLTSIGLVQGLQERAAGFIYGEDRPAMLRQLDARMLASAAGPYIHHRLDFPDIVEAAGFVLDPDRPPQRIWPGVGAPLETSYGDPHSTVDWQEAALIRYEQKESKSPIECDTWEQMHSALGEQRIAKLTMEAIEPVIERLRNFEQWRTRFHPQPQQVTKRWTRERAAMLSDMSRRLYALRVKWSDAARKARIPRQEGFIHPIGPAFERYVANRAVAWIRSHERCAGAIQSVWTAAKVRPPRSPSDTIEMDVVIVLKNAVVLNLECKAGESDLKDLTARTLQMQRSTSRLARMLVCIPLLPAASGLRSFRKQHELEHRLRQAGVEVARVNVPDTPCSYTWDGQLRTPPTFEQSLERLLTPFLP